jgi:hypothetical protein
MGTFFLFQRKRLPKPAKDEHQVWPYVLKCQILAGKQALCHAVVSSKLIAA